MIISRLFIIVKMFQTQVIEKLKTHVLCSVDLFLKNRLVYEAV
jgi:hypothetical protein